MTTPSPNPSHGPAPRWTREQIRAARLAPLLQRRGLQLFERQTGSYELAPYPDLIFKDNYWRWPPTPLRPQFSSRRSGPTPKRM